MTELVTGKEGPAVADPGIATAGAEPAVARVSQWADIRARFLANKLAVVGLVIVLALVWSRSSRHSWRRSIRSSRTSPTPFSRRAASICSGPTRSAAISCRVSSTAAGSP